MRSAGYRFFVRVQRIFAAMQLAAVQCSINGETNVGSGLKAGKQRREDQRERSRADREPPEGFDADTGAIGCGEVMGINASHPHHIAHHGLPNR